MIIISSGSWYIDAEILLSVRWWWCRGGSRVWKGGVHFVEKVEDQKKKEMQNE